VAAVRVLNRYIGWRLLLGSFAILVILMTLVGATLLFEELESVGEGRYDIGAALLYVIMMLPSSAYQLFPVALLLGSLAGLGSLAVHSELVAMRAAGIAQGRIVRSMMRAGLGLMLLAVLVGELVAPASQQYAYQMRGSLKSEKETMRSEYGFWARDGASFVNIRQILPGNQLAGLYLYLFDARGELSRAVHAERAYFQDGRWHLASVRQTHLSVDGTSVTYLDQTQGMDLLDPALLDLVLVKPDMLPIWSLYRYIDFLRENDQEAQQYEVIFWGRLTRPLVALAMLFLSAPLLFGNLRSAGIGWRLFVGALIGLGFFMTNKAISYMAMVYGFSPPLASLLPVVAVAFIGGWFLRRHE
jgi:lipopolysaccharide export system permease protein